MKKILFNNKAHLLAITAGDINLASSRLRSFKLFQNLDGYFIHRDPSISNLIKSKYVHIQKKTNGLIILLAIFSRLFNKVVIFDFDDDHFSNRENLYRVLLFILSNKIVVDTKSRLNFITQKWPFISNKIFYLPDMLDFNLDIISNDINYSGCDNFDLLWYGYPNNIGSIKFIFEYLAYCRNKNIHVISSSKEDVISNLGNNLWNDEYCKFVKWEPNILEKFNCNNHIVILNHDWERNSNLKSENKLVLALAYGFPVVASNTQAYFDFCDKLNILQILYSPDKNFLFDSFLKTLSNSNVFIDQEKLLEVINNSISKEVIQSGLIKILID